MLHLIGFASEFRSNLVSHFDLAIDDGDQSNDATVTVVPAVEQQSSKGFMAIAMYWWRNVLDDGL